MRKIIIIVNSYTHARYHGRSRKRKKKEKEIVPANCDFIFTFDTQGWTKIVVCIFKYGGGGGNTYLCVV